MVSDSPKTIVWNPLALDDYHGIIEYLLEAWSPTEAIGFISDVDSVLKNLETGVVRFKLCDYRNVRQCVICKQVTLYYFENENNQIELLRFWNTYQDNANLGL
ncbi:MAG: type II toxin-antitoxin system RelE/ParE family toxin [Salinivirgaceae bacterium]|jgi:plasmid stabilization system protein ParE|nr:type II toxin-antitoxin system RelE/ParE family toxin [Salinivirgaceae bacterium]